MCPKSTTVNGRHQSYLQVAAELRARIRSGRLPAGAKMPTQSSLAEEFGVERGVIRQALRVLHDEKLLTNVSRGSPPTVAEAPVGGEGGDARPQPTTVALAPRLVEAFSAPHVRIDALCLTAESLSMALTEPVRLIHAGTIRPEKVEVRVLLPSRDINLAFPIAVEDDKDDRLHQRWLEQRNLQGRVLRNYLVALRNPPYGIDVCVAFRALPFTPPVKMYILNDAEVLFGYYTITRGEAEIGSEAVQMYDALGTQAMLFPFLKAENASRDATFVEQSQLWFNALWETITSDLTLS